MKWDHLSEEVAAHIEEKALELIEAGVPEKEAWERARREFGNPTLVVESSRQVWMWTWLEHLGQDVRYAFRTMAGNRMFTAVAVASLALGIGANTAIYSFMDAILLRSLPVKDPEALAVLKFERPGGPKGRVRMSMHTRTGGAQGNNFAIFSYPAYELFRQRTDLFESLFAYHAHPDTRFTMNQSAVLGDCLWVTGNYFAGLSVSARAGRSLTQDDDREGAPPVAVVSASFAQEWFGSLSDAVGKLLTVNGVSFTVVGVTPPGFFGAAPEITPEVYVPLHTYMMTQPARLAKSGGKPVTETALYWLNLMGRLKPGVTHRQVESALTPVFAEYFRVNNGGEEKARMIVLEGAGGLDSLRIRYSKPLFVLMAMVGLILLIACANIANLLLARSAARRREIAVRLSMGAGRLRVIRQLLTESVLLSMSGGVFGLLIAMWGIRALTALLAMGREDFTLRAGLNWPVLGATFAIAMATGVLFGLAPAWQATRVDVFPALRETRSSAGGPRRRWMPVSLSQVLVVAQITLSLLLLIGAGLFVRTLSKLQSLELGFNQENLLLLGINTQQAGYQQAAALRLHESLRQRFESIPGIRKVSLSADGQLSGGTWGLQFTVPDSKAETKASAPLLPVGPNYLTTMQIPIVLGRDISVEDGQRQLTATVISESFAKKHYGTDNPIGRHISMTFDATPEELEIVGVAKDARYGSLKGPPPAMLYVDYRHHPNFLADVINLVMRTTGTPAQMAPIARQILREADPGLPLGTVTTQTQQIESTISQQIIFARLCTIFAVLALVIACVGLYGTTGYSVARRTSEFGIRMALGARRACVLGMVLREIVVLALAGLVIGIPIALATSDLLKSFLFELQPNDPWAIGAAIAILMAAAIFAGLVPAQRAARIDPMTALRHE